MNSRRKNSRRTRSTQTGLDYQRFENRQLLAGDVTVTLQDDILQVLGDSAANEIRLSGTPDGHLQVVAASGTTINGGSTPFSVNVPVRNVTVRMGDGADAVTIENLVALGFLDLDLGAGDDSSQIRDINVRTLNVDGRAGNDVMQFHNTFSHGYITIQGEAGDDTISITAMAADRGMIVDTGTGADIVAIDNLGIRDELIMRTGEGSDRVFITGEFYAHKTTIDLGTDNDTLSVTPQISQTTATFQRRMNIQAGEGDDTVFFGPGVNARKSVTVNGGPGEDALGVAGANLRRPQYSQFENGNLTEINAALQAFYTSLQSLNIDTAPFGQAFVATVLNLQDSSLVVPANSGPLAIDNALQLTGGDTTIVSGATVRVQNPVSTEDVLAFTNLGNISGAFDAATGILTLTGSGSLAQYQAALRTVTYDNTRSPSVAGTKQITVEVSTGTGTVSDARSLTLQGIDAPLLSVSNDPLVIPQTSPAVAIDDQLTLTGDSTTNVSGATVAVVNFTAGQDVLAFTNANGITGTFDAATGVLTLTGTTTLANYQTALRTVTYDSSAPQFAAKTISFVVTTDAGNTNDTRSLVPAAVLNVTSAPLKHYGISPANAVDSQLGLTGQAGTTVTQATVAIARGYASGQDLLAFANTSNIIGSFDAATGTMTLTGSATIDEYQAALRSVTYDNTQTTTLEESRDIEIVVTTNRGNFTGLRGIDLGDQLEIAAFAEDNNLTTQVTSSGLHYIIDTVGNGTFPTLSDTVRVNYVGTLTNGTEFDANDNITFPLTGVIQGWQEGIPLFSVGGSGRLIIPSSLAYGPSGTGGIPGNSVLVFDIDLLGIEP